MKPQIALTIAGSDPSGGAGIQADLKTFHQLKVFGTAVITLITVQNSTRFSRVEMLDPDLVAEQIAAVIEDTPPHAVKTGALGTEAIVEAVTAAKLNCPLVVDPVMLSKHGAALLVPGSTDAVRKLFRKAALVTPNLEEAGTLTGMPVTDIEQMKEAAKRIEAPSVLVKGGHLKGEAIDVLLYKGEFIEFSGPRIRTRHTHGTGCTYSAAITAFLARGLEIPEAVQRAKEFIQAAITNNPGLGKGSGPLNHWV